ncbi:hypothetical protein [Sphingobacterium sp. SYP-B4668]|uniref:hypothetical protein n=1 Tax=Sphingobacterium sp. SYP-B4668 TaxID=2996035 RepID=UPI0022DE439F|nr:hypothetical protein [Sphingobacterium sp. SYP-B4668]
MNYIKYYRVYKNQTDVVIISANDFARSPWQSCSNEVQQEQPSTDVEHYTLNPNFYKFRDYTDIILAMERAKSGALCYINSLLSEATKIIITLKTFRADNYQNLNHNLLDRHIRQLEQNIKHN